jgi:AraC-like DNA-binding protein
MISIEHMQFAGIVLTSALTAMLALLLPHWQTKNKVFSKSRKLMTAGTVLLPIQFLLQYTLHFRQMGVTQAVMVNLLFFVPAAWLISVAVLNLLRQGRVKLHEWAVGAGAYLLVVTVLAVAEITDGQSILAGTAEMRTAEMISAVIYLLMQVYYCTLEIWEVRRMKRALAGFYDYDTSQLTGWFGVSVILLGLSGLMAPIAIFWSDGWLLIYSLTLFFTIFYCVINFYSYGIDHAGQQTISEAEENAKEAGLDDEKSGNVMDVTEKLHIEQMVNRWILNGGYTKSGITMQNVVDEIGIPRYQLTAWLKTTEWELFNPWLTDLRVKEAKRQIRLHPDWSNDTIAERCGFSSRSYFQTVFRKNTGMTPAQFIQLCQGLNNK